MDANDLIALASKSRYLTAVEVGDSLRLTIAHVSVESMKGQGGDEKDKGVVWFEEDPRGLVLNVSLGQLLREMFGVDLQNWIGKRLELFNDRSVQGKSGKKVGGIRIKSSPDIPSDVTMVVGRSPFSKGTQYTVRADRDSSADPLAEALHAAGLSVAAFDSWAESAGRPPAAKMPPEKRAQAARWIRSTGHEAIRGHVEKADSAPDDFDPMAV